MKEKGMGKEPKKPTKVIDIQRVLDRDGSYDEIKVLLSDGTYQWNSKNKNALERIIRSFRENSENTVLACILIYIYFAGDDAIDFSRKRGVFAYYMQWSGTTKILSWLSTNKEQLDISNEIKLYIAHKYAIDWLIDFYWECDSLIDRAIEEHEEKRKICQGKKS